MKYKLLFSFLFLWLLVVPQVQAQRTLIYEDPVKYYNRGIELLDKAKYGAAIEQFHTFAEKGNDQLLQINAQYYAALCAAELYNPDALGQFQQIIANHPNNPKAALSQYQIGRYYYHINYYKKALENLERVEMEYLSDADLVEFHFIKGYSSFKRKKYDQAKTSFAEIKDAKEVNGKKNKYYYSANYYHGYVTYQNRELKEALNSFQKVTKSKIYGEVSKLYITQIYFGLGEYRKAIAYGDTVKTKRHDPDIRFVVGQSYFQLGEYAKATPYLEQYIKSGRYLQDEDIYRLAYSYYASEQYEAAYLEFQKIAYNNDSLGQYASYNMADCFIKLDKKQSARNAFYNCVKFNFDPQITETSFFNYAKLSAELAYHNLAIIALRDFVNMYPRSAYGDEAKGLLSQLLLNTKDYKAAIPILESIKIKSNDIKEAYQKVTYYRAEQLYANKDFKGARNLFKKSVTYDFDRKLYGLSFFWLGEIHYKEGKYQDALLNYRIALRYTEIQKTRFYALAHYNMGYSYFNLEEYANAVGAFKKVLDLESFFGKNKDFYLDAYMRSADAHFMLRNYEKAADAYDYAISKNAPSSDYALFQRGTIMGILNKPDNKVKVMQGILNQYPRSKYVDDALFEIASTQLKQETYDEAIVSFRKLIQEHPKSTYVKKAYLNIGLIYYNRTQDDQALIEYKKVVDLYPNTPESKQAFAAIQNIYIKRGESDAYLKFVESKPGNNVTTSFKDSITYEAAFNLYKDAQYDKALTRLNQYLKDFPNGYFRLGATFYKAECDYRAKNFEEALIGYEYVISQSRSQYSERSYRQAANVHYFKKNYEQAYQYYKQLEEYAESKDMEMIAYIGQMRCSYAIKNLEETKSNAEKLLSFEKSTKDALIESHLFMGRVFMDMSLPDSAISHFEYVLKETKNVFAAEAKYNLCHISFLQKGILRAKNMIFELSDNYSAYDYWVAKGFILLSDVYVVLKDNFQAKQTLQSIIDNYPGEDLKQLAQEKLDDLVSKEEQQDAALKKKAEELEEQQLEEEVQDEE